MYVNKVNGKKEPFLVTQELIDLYKQAGIDPSTGMPTRVKGTPVEGTPLLKQSIYELLSRIDAQDAVNRFQWYNLPVKMSSVELERLLYLKGNLCLFYFTELDEFFIMPYALDAGLDFYGRYKSVHPIPLCDEDDPEYKKQAAVLAQKHLKVLYDIPTEPLEGGPGDYCVLIHDYTSCNSAQDVLPRSSIQQGLLDVMSDCIPFMRTALLNGTGVAGMRVGSKDEATNVINANLSVDRAAVTGKKWIPIVGQLDFQDLTGGQIAKGEEYLMAMQSLDNFRLSTYGLENGGLFEKKQYQNNAQTMLNGSGQIGNALQDSLANRQFPCDIANAAWGLGMWCDVSEAACGMDLNMDGLAGSEQDQSGIPGQQPAQQGGIQ